MHEQNIAYILCINTQVAIVNLDPANDVLPYEPEVDVSDLVDLQSVMDVSSVCMCVCVCVAVCICV